MCRQSTCPSKIPNRKTCVKVLHVNQCQLLTVQKEFLSYQKYLQEVFSVLMVDEDFAKKITDAGGELVAKVAFDMKMKYENLKVLYIFMAQCFIWALWIFGLKGLAGFMDHFKKA